MIYFYPLNKILVYASSIFYNRFGGNEFNYCLPTKRRLFSNRYHLSENESDLPRYQKGRP